MRYQEVEYSINRVKHSFFLHELKPTGIEGTIQIGSLLKLGFQLTETQIICLKI